MKISQICLKKLRKSSPRDVNSGQTVVSHLISGFNALVSLEFQIFYTTQTVLYVALQILLLKTSLKFQR